MHFIYCHIYFGFSCKELIWYPDFIPQPSALKKIAHTVAIGPVKIIALCGQNHFLAVSVLDVKNAWADERNFLT